MDLGGDGPRLYFYDPLNFLKSRSLYHIVPWSTGEVRPDFYNLPFLLLLIGLKWIVHSPTVIIALFNSLKLVGAFLAVYAIMKELLHGRSEGQEKLFLIELVAILSGIFYVFSPGMSMSMYRPLLSHDQVFLNPIMFYLMLQFFLSSKIKYLWLGLLTTLLFSHNFSYASAPPFFAFYPISLAFLIIYVLLIRRKKLFWGKILIGIVVFLGLHAFHLVPEIANLFDPQSNVNSRVFNKEDIQSQQDVFFGVNAISNIKVSLGIFAQAPFYEWGWVSIVVPLTVVFGFLLNKKRDKTIIITGIFFLITFFLITAKIGYSPVQFYSKLFYIPGFSMFRNFWVQWGFVSSFFYALLFGQALYFIFKSLTKKHMLILFVFILSLLTIHGWQIISGAIVNKTIFQTKDVKTAIVMDPLYEEALEFIRSLPSDSKILTLPFSDCCYQVIFGVNKAAYVGMSPIAHLTGKNDFVGHGSSVPFSQSFFELAKNHDYERFKEMLGLLNILHVFYNSDPRIYDTGDFYFPYSPAYSRAFFPQNQAEYKDFVEKISTKKIFERGTYSIYEIDKSIFLPHFYLADSLAFYEDDPSYGIYEKSKSFLTQTVDSKAKTSRGVTYLEKSICKSDLYALKLCGVKSVGELQNAPKITFQKINKTKYKILVTNVHNPYMLIFSNAFHKDWKIYLSQTTSLTSEAVTNTYFNGQVSELNQKDTFFDSKTFETVFLPSVVDKTHIMVNGYANGWYIEPTDFGGKSEYELIVELKSQRVFYFCLAISAGSFIGFILWGIVLFRKRNNN